MDMVILCCLFCPYLSTMIPARMAWATLRNFGFSCPLLRTLFIDLVKVKANQSLTSVGTASGSTSLSSSSSSVSRLQSQGYNYCNNDTKVKFAGGLFFEQKICSLSAMKAKKKPTTPWIIYVIFQKRRARIKTPIGCKVVWATRLNQTEPLHNIIKLKHEILTDLCIWNTAVIDCVLVALLQISAISHTHVKFIALVQWRSMFYDLWLSDIYGL